MFFTNILVCLHYQLNNCIDLDLLNLQNVIIHPVHHYLKSLNIHLTPHTYLNKWLKNTAGNYYILTIDSCYLINFIICK